MKYNISIWSVQWVAIDESGKYTPIVEIHLSYNSAISRLTELVEISPDKFEEIYGCSSSLTSGISMSEFRI